METSGLPDVGKQQFLSPHGTDRSWGSSSNCRKDHGVSLPALVWGGWNGDVEKVRRSAGKENGVGGVPPEGRNKGQVDRKGVCKQVKPASCLRPQRPECSSVAHVLLFLSAFIILC